MPGEPLKMLAGIELPQPLIDRLVHSCPNVSFTIANHREVFDHLAVADALLGWGLPADRTAEARNLRWIQTIGAGVDGLDYRALAERGIVVTNSSGIHAVNIAEHVLSMMLAFARRLPDHLDSQRQERWNVIDRSTITPGPPLFEITGQTLFVVGMGRIGEALAKRARGLEMRVVGVVRRAEKERSANVDELLLLPELESRISEADHVAICLPLTDATRGLFGRDMLARMKPGAFIYNIGRGPIIDQAALYDALRHGHLGGAGLDVTDPEPLPPGDPLWKLGNVIITPHTSGHSPGLWDRGVDLWIENIRRYSAGEPLLNVVDLDAQY